MLCTPAGGPSRTACTVQLLLRWCGRHRGQNPHSPANPGARRTWLPNSTKQALGLPVSRCRVMMMSTICSHYEYGAQSVEGAQSVKAAQPVKGAQSMKAAQAVIGSGAACPAPVGDPTTARCWWPQLEQPAAAVCVLGAGKVPPCQHASKRAYACYAHTHVQAPEEVGHHLLIQVVRDVAQERLRQQQPAKMVTVKIRTALQLRDCPGTPVAAATGTGGCVSRGAGRETALARPCKPSSHPCCNRACSCCKGLLYGVLC